jgi:hypothetical protein
MLASMMLATCHSLAAPAPQQPRQRPAARPCRPQRAARLRCAAAAKQQMLVRTASPPAPPTPAPTAHAGTHHPPPPTPSQTS